MPKPLGHYTAMARRLDSDVRFALPARNPEITSARTTALAMSSALLGPLPVLTGALGARVVTRRDTAHRQALVRTIVLAVSPERVTAHRLARFGRRIEPAIDSWSTDGLSYRSTDVMLETILTIDGIDWLVHGWYERELRAALAALDTDDPKEAP